MPSTKPNAPHTRIRNVQLETRMRTVRRFILPEPNMLFVRLKLNS